MRPLVFTSESSARFALAFALLVWAGCFGTPRTSWPDADFSTGGSGGAGGTGGTGGIAMGGVGGCSETLDRDPKNCGACGRDCLGGTCERSVCTPFKLADLPHESVRTIGLSPEYVLVSGAGYTDGAAAIYTVSKLAGVVNRTRPPRVDGSFSTRLAGTPATLVAADVFNVAPNLVYLSHCAIADCSATVPPSGSYTFDGIHDFAFDPLRGRVFWFDSTSHELISTSADAWVPASGGPVTVTGQSDCRGMAQGNGRVFGLFNYGVVAIPEDGDLTPSIVSGLPTNVSIVEIAVSAASLIMRSQVGALYKAPLPAGIGTKEPDAIPGISGATAIATFGAKLFWAGVSTIYMCSLPLCEQGVPIAQDASVIRDIIADDKAVYWLSQPDVTDPTSSVMRVAF
jgi:hypothetical protein